MVIAGFDVGKGIMKFLLGAIATGLTLIIQNPSAITALIPEKLATMTLVGAIVELLDFVLYKIKEKASA